MMFEGNAVGFISAECSFRCVRSEGFDATSAAAFSRRSRWAVSECQRFDLADERWLS